MDQGKKMLEYAKPEILPSPPLCLRSSCLRAEEESVEGNGIGDVPNHNHLGVVTFTDTNNPHFPAQIHFYMS